MGLPEVTLECPYCHCTFQNKPPDHLHSAFSFEKPLPGDYHGEIVSKNYVCKNPKCKKRLKVFWYAPMSYFDRI